MQYNETVIWWQSDTGEWWIQPAPDTSAMLLETWAAKQEPLSAVELVLSAKNYAAHWVSLPGVKGRHLQRALPFALEDSLIGDLADYTILPGGSTDGRHCAYAVETDLLDRLQEQLELHHLRLARLTPQTALVAANQCIHDGTRWLLVAPGLFEGSLPQAALTTVLDDLAARALDDSRALTLYAQTLDQAALVKTSIDSGYADVFAPVEVSNQGAKGKESAVNLLQGRANTVVAEAKPAAWWRGIAAFTAFVTVLGCGYLVAENQRLSGQVEQVTDASRTLYKQWFPGESSSNFQARFNRKLREGGGSTSGAAFDAVMADIAHAWRTSSAATVDIESIRYSERNGDFQLDVSAKGQADLQALKQALNEAVQSRGLAAEISSATADKDRVKGRLKIGGAA
ncbi:MAG: type II secretion system protein GspL [Pseudomonadota bacterium]|nr:type II secretion system protein GspL [Pseudomonadota bacterium]